MTQLGEALCRAHEIFPQDFSDATDEVQRMVAWPWTARQKALQRSPRSEGAKGWMIGLEALDRDLCRAYEIFLDNMSDETEKELDELLPGLIQAGYLEESGHSPTGSFWAFTTAGVKRRKELGCS
jgi:hypothetical protein